MRSKCKEHSGITPCPPLSGAGFLNLSTINVLDCIILCCGGLFGVWQVVLSTSNLYRLDGSSSPSLSYCALGVHLPAVKNYCAAVKVHRRHSLDLWARVRSLDFILHTGWGKIRCTVVCMGKNTILNK